MPVTTRNQAAKQLLHEIQTSGPTTTSPSIIPASLHEQIRRVDGCRDISVACPLEAPKRLWVIIEWKSIAHRTSFRQSDKFAQTLAKILCLAGAGADQKTQLIHRFRDHQSAVKTLDRMLYCELKTIYEIWIIYLPIEMSEEEMVGYQTGAGHRGLDNFFSRGEEESNPMTAIIGLIPGWMEGEVEYQRQRCRRVAWFIRWKSRDAEELYKTTVKASYTNIVIKCGKKRRVPEVKLAVDLFIDDLKSHGMLGHETWHAYFETIDPF